MIINLDWFVVLFPVGRRNYTHGKFLIIRHGMTLRQAETFRDTVAGNFPGFILDIK